MITPASITQIKHLLESMHTPLPSTVCYHVFSCQFDPLFMHSVVLLLLLGDQSDQKLALRNIASMVRPGGVLIIDHRNYDYILETGRAPQGKNIYYKVPNIYQYWIYCSDYSFYNIIA